MEQERLHPDYLWDKLMQDLKHKGEPEEYLREQNFKVIGSGYYSSVFLCPWDTSKVIKINNNDHHIGDIYRDAYLAFVLFCMKSKRNGIRCSALPDIHKLYVSPNAKFYCVLLDYYEATLEQVLKEKYRNQYANTMRSKYNSLRNGLEGRPYSVRYGYKGMWEIGNRLHKMKGWHPHDDLHYGNIMLHKGRMIIIDPISRSDVGPTEIHYGLVELGLVKTTQRVYDRLRSKRRQELYERKLHKTRFQNVRNVIYCVTVDATGNATPRDYSSYNEFTRRDKINDFLSSITYDQIDAVDWALCKLKSNIPTVVNAHPNKEKMDKLHQPKNKRELRRKLAA